MKREITFAAVDGTIDESSAGKKGPPQQWHRTCMTSEAALSGVPVLSLMGHLTLVHSYRIATRVAVFSKSGIETVQTEGATISHHIPFPPQLTVTLKAAEMAHVPGSSLGLCAFVCKDNLETRERLKHTLPFMKTNLHFQLPTRQSGDFNMDW